MKKILTLLAIVGLFASCDNNESTSLEKNEIRFSTAVSLEKSTYASTQVAKDQKVGLYINEIAQNPTAPYEQNIAYTADGEGNMAGPLQFFPSNGNSIKISAYHPYYDGENDNYVFTVEKDQTETANIYASDLLYCPEFEQKPTAQQIVLKFRHKLSQITYTLRAGNGNPDLKDAKVSVVNAYSAIEFNRLTGELGDLSKKQEMSLSSSGGIIVPQEIAAGTNFLKIVLASGKQLYYTPDKAINLESGKKYNFELLVNMSEASSLGTSVDEWGLGETITGNVEENTSDKLLPVQINYNMPNSTNSRYVFEYDDQNKLSILEIYDHPYTIGENEIIDYSKYTFSYNNNGEVSGYYADLVNNSDPKRSMTIEATITYDSPTQVSLNELITQYGKTTSSTWIITVDEYGRYLSSNKDQFTSTPVNTYDAKGNLIKRIEKTSNENGDAIEMTTTYDYDSKNYFLRDLNMPGWLINYFANQDGKSPNNVIKKTIVTTKNGTIIPRNDDGILKWEYTYNTQNYPTEFKYTVASTENGKDFVYTTTATYKSLKK